MPAAEDLGLELTKQQLQVGENNNTCRGNMPAAEDLGLELTKQQLQVGENNNTCRVACLLLKTWG